MKPHPHPTCMSDGHVFRRSKEDDELPPKRQRPLYGWKCKRCEIVVWSIVKQRPNTMKPESASH